MSTPDEDKKGGPAVETGHPEDSTNTVGSGVNFDRAAHNAAVDESLGTADTAEPDFSKKIRLTDGSSPMDAISAFIEDMAWNAKPQKFPTLIEMIGSYVAYLFITQHRCVEDISAKRLAAFLGKSEPWFIERVHRWARLGRLAVPDGRSRRGRDEISDGMKRHHRARRHLAKSSFLHPRAALPPGRPGVSSVADILALIGNEGSRSGEIVRRNLENGVSTRTTLRRVSEAVKAGRLVKSGPLYRLTNTRETAAPAPLENLA